MRHWSTVTAPWLAAVLSAISCADGAVRHATPRGRTFDSVDAYVTETMRAARIPGVSVAIVAGDRVAYLKGFGRADASGRPVTPQTPFLIGSVTKSMTALAVLQLVDEGKVDLDAPVQRYIPWFRAADSIASARITVRHLLTMSSGLPQSYATQLRTDRDDRALERTVRHVRNAELTGPVGSAVGYSNANYETLGLIVQTVSGTSYEEYVQRHVFAPLDMRNSFVSQDAAMRHGMASGHRWWFGIPVPAALPYNRGELPAGYVIASAEDMSHYMIAELNDGRFGSASVLSPRGMALRHTEPPPKAYCYGWEFVRSNGRVLIDHDGGTADFQTSLFMDPEAHVGVFVAANAMGLLDAFSSPPGGSRLDGQTTRAMAHTILSLVTNQPLPDRGPGHEQVTLIVNLVLAVLTGALAISLARIPHRYRQLSRAGFADRAAFARHVAPALVAIVVLPAALLYLWLAAPAWRVVAQFQPDLAFWLTAVAIILVLKALVEVALAWYVLAHPPRRGDAEIRTRIVVAGGGVGGLAAARHLDQELGHRDDVEITLVNRDNFFLLTPLLFEACSGVIELRHCAQPIRPCLDRVRFIEGTVDEIDVERRVVRTTIADRGTRELPYDHVVVALGATTNLSLIRGSQHARTFKTVADALLLRNHVVEQLERADVETDPRRRQRMLTIVVIGGGLVGVELLGELSAFVYDELRYYPRIGRDEPRFHLFEAGDRLLPESKRFIAEYAERTLRKRGAELHVGVPVQAIEPNVVRWADGVVEADTIVLAAGIVPNSTAAATDVTRDRRGRIVTEPTLRSVSDEHVWAFGDCASTPGPDGKPYPALAQHAVRAARVVARNIAAVVHGRAPKPFVFHALGLMAALGHTRAACDLRGLHVTGFPAWWVRRTYYLFQMPRWETRLRIALDWTVSLFYRPDLTKIDLSTEREQEVRNCAADGSPHSAEPWRDRDDASHGANGARGEERVKAGHQS
jgi:NADH:ubiquinone reductase (H+-translocating)